MDLKIEKRQVNGVTIVSCQGRIMFGDEANALRDFLKEALAETPRMVLNLAGVTYIDSGGLGTLVGVYSSARGRWRRYQADWVGPTLAGRAADYQAGYGFRSFQYGAGSSHRPRSRRGLVEVKTLPPRWGSSGRKAKIELLTCRSRFLGRRIRAGQQEMSFQPITGPVSSPGSGIFPTLVFVQGNDQRTINLDHTPFTVGRKVDKDLVIADPRVSRDHALITSEDGQFHVVDQGSKHGTFVNGERIQRKTLERNDRVEFGVRDVSYVIFHPHHASSNTAREFLSQISGIQISTDSTDLEKLTLFLEAARKLNTTGVLDEILVTLLDATLKLTRAERGYVFMRDEENNLRLAAGTQFQGRTSPRRHNDFPLHPG